MVSCKLRKEQALASVGDVRWADGLEAVASGRFHGLAAKVVDGAKVAAGDLEDRIESLLVEEVSVAPGNSKSMLDVLSALWTSEGSEGCEVSDSLTKGLKVAMLQERAKAAIAAKNEAQEQS